MQPTTAIALALLPVVLMAGHAQAQSEAAPEPRVKVSRSMDIDLEREYELRQQVRVEYKTAACKANLRVEYYQKEALAHVKSTLTNDQCAASHGDYTIQVRYQNAAGEVETAEFPETWERQDAAPLVSEKDYPIGADVDVIRVKTSGLSCECARPAAPMDTVDADRQ